MRAELRREIFGCAGDCAEAFEPDEGGSGDVSFIGEEMCLVRGEREEGCLEREAVWLGQIPHGAARPEGIY